MVRPASYATVGSLATALRGATVLLREVERDVDDFVAGLFPGWRPLFPPGRGWRFTAPDALEIYGVVESPATTDAIWRAGFRRIVVHSHRVDGHCMCIPKIDPAPPGATATGQIDTATRESGRIASIEASLLSPGKLRKPRRPKD